MSKNDPFEATEVSESSSQSENQSSFNVLELMKEMNKYGTSKNNEAVSSDSKKDASSQTVLEFTPIKGLSGDDKGQGRAQIDGLDYGFGKGKPPARDSGTGKPGQPPGKPPGDINNPSDNKPGNKAEKADKPMVTPDGKPDDKFSGKETVKSTEVTIRQGDNSNVLGDKTNVHRKSESDVVKLPGFKVEVKVDRVNKDGALIIEIKDERPEAQRPKDENQHAINESASIRFNKDDIDRLRQAGKPLDFNVPDGKGTVVTVNEHGHVTKVDTQDKNGKKVTYTFK